MKKNGPWIIKDSKIVYKNSWLEVREDQVIQPDGKDSIYAVVTKGQGLVVLPMDDEGYVYLLNEFRYAVGQVSIETPSGTGDDGEVDLDAAKRELREEAGIIAEEWTDFGVVHALTSNVYAPQRLFLARKLSFTDVSRDGTEVMEVRKVKFDEAVRMVMDNEITYTQACLLILKAKLFLEAEGV